MTKNTGYYVIAGLLYPSALGAAIAWLVPALALAQHTHGREPSWWSVVFGVWFLVYHSMWFIHLVRASENRSYEYTGRRLTSDLIDVFVIFVAFWGLGFASAQYADAVPWLVYGAALLIPVSAAFEHKFQTAKSILAVIVPAGVAASGVIRHWSSAALDAYDPWLLFVLTLLLVVYVCAPVSLDPSA